MNSFAVPGPGGDVIDILDIYLVSYITYYITVILEPWCGW